MELRERVAAITSKEDLADFVGALRKDLEAHGDKWENATLECFLEAMQAWIEDSDGYYLNMGQPVPQPKWRTFAEILIASKVYE
jgi:hypothetical protein